MVDKLNWRCEHLQECVAHFFSLPDYAPRVASWDLLFYLVGARFNSILLQKCEFVSMFNIETFYILKLNRRIANSIKKID